MRDAVMALYDELAPTQTQLQANGLRLRYGVVPYSSTVNVGALIRAVNPAYLADNATYSSRVANYDEAHATYVGTRAAARAAGDADLWQLDLAIGLRQIWPQCRLLGLLAQRHERRRPGADPGLEPGFLEQRSGGDRLELVGRERYERDQPQLPPPLCRDRHHLSDGRPL